MDPIPIRIRALKYLMMSRREFPQLYFMDRRSSYLSRIYGKNYKGYRTVSDLADAIEKALSIAIRLHPKYELLFLLDNSSNNQAAAPDVLNVNELNLDDGGRNTPLLRTTFFFDENGERVEQRMQFSSDNQKGISTKLKERGLWESSFTFPMAKKLLSEQTDFAAPRKPLLRLTKFHPEFNFIEIYWGFRKGKTRLLCDFSLETLERVVREILDSVPLPIIRKFARKRYRYMDEYF